MSRRITTDILSTIPTPGKNTNVSGNSWASMTPDPVPRVSTTGGVVGSMLYVASGSTNGSGNGSVAGNGASSVNYGFNPVTNVWTSYASDSNPRYNSAAAAVGNYLYGIGGTLSGSSASNLNEGFNPTTNTWTSYAVTLASMSECRAGSDGASVYVNGGYNGTSYLSTFYSWSISSNTWTTLTSMPSYSQNQTDIMLNGILYAALGNAAKMYGYSLSTSTWTTYTSYNATARYGATGQALNNQVYVTGGSDGSSGLYGVSAFNPSLNSWTDYASDSGGNRVDATSGVISGILYADGGSTVFEGSTMNTTTTAYTITQDAYVYPILGTGETSIFIESIPLVPNTPNPQASVTSNGQTIFNATLSTPVAVQLASGQQILTITVPSGGSSPTVKLWQPPHR